MTKYKQLTLFVEDSHVKTSQQQAKAKALSMVTGLVFGGKCTDLSITYNQELQCWKTYPLCCGKTEACTLSCMTWPQSGMMQSGQLYQQDNLVHPTYENVSLSLPTPTASDATVGNIMNENTKIVWTKNGTPRKVSKNGVSGSVGLARFVKLLPTPTANEHKYRLKGNSQASKCLEARARRGELSGTKGRLNPEFVEWMMGFPEGWTE